MTTTQELLESSFELNLSNYGPEDVERLNDWAIKAHNALEAAQAEIKVQTRAADHWMAEANKSHNLTVTQQAEIERLNGYVQKANMDVTAACVERDKALARLAELEKQEPVIYQAKTKPGFLSTSAYAWEDCEKADFLVYEADGVHVRGLYAAAGASLVATPIVAWAKSTPRKLRITTMDMGREDGWRPLGYTAAGASPVEPSQALPPAPGEAAREYMTGYSDGREWAGATSQAQPSQAPLTDAEIEKLREKTFSTNNPFCPVDSKSMRKAVRAAEAAHGIKQGDQQ